MNQKSTVTENTFGNVKFQSGSHNHVAFQTIAFSKMSNINFEENCVPFLLCCLEYYWRLVTSILCVNFVFGGVFLDVRNDSSVLINWKRNKIKNPKHRSVVPEIAFPTINWKESRYLTFSQAPKISPGFRN